MQLRYQTHIFSPGVSFLARANKDNRKNAPKAAVLLLSTFMK